MSSTDLPGVAEQPDDADHPDVVEQPDDVVAPTVNSDASDGDAGATVDDDVAASTSHHGNPE